MQFTFDEAENAFMNLQEANKLPPKIEHKLQLLLDCIQANPNDVTRYDQLDESECHALMKLNRIAQQEMFVQIVKGFAANSFIPSSLEIVIQGEIDIRTQLLHNWKTKKFKIDVKVKTFEILRSVKSTKKPRIIELPYYSVQPLEFKYDRHRFTLQANVDGHGYYKTLVCGSKDEPIYKKMLEALRTISQFKAHPLKGSVLMPAPPAHPSEQEVMKKRMSIQPLIQQSIISMKEDEEDEPVQNQANQPVAPQKKMVTIRKEAPNGGQQQPQQQSPQPIPQQQQRQTIQVTQPPALDSTPTKSPITSPMPQIQENLIEEKGQSVPVIFEWLQERGMLEEDYFLRTSKSFTSHLAVNGLQILKSNDKNLLFRTILTVQSTEVERVFQVLAEIEFVKKWNSVINSDESRFLNLIGSEKCGIIYQKNKPYGYLYLPRDFVFMRFVYRRGKDILILDKSVVHESAQPQMRVIRGEINYQIIEIKLKENEIEVKIETEQTNGGLSSSGQDQGMTCQYLIELQNLNQFVKTYSNAQLISSPLLSCLHTEAKVVQFIEQPEPEQAEQQFQEEMEIQKSKIQDLPDAYAPVKIPLPIPNQQLEQVNEIQQYNQDIEEVIEQSSYVPSDFVTNTLPVLPSEEVEKVKKLISIVERNEFYSFCIKHRYQNEPIQAKEEFMKEIDGGHYFLRQDWKRDSKGGGMIFLNQKKIEAQKRVIKFMLKSIGSNLLSGKSILNISLPVEIFEIRSNLERFAYSFTFAPRFLEQGSKVATPAEQMKFTLAFGMSSIIMYMSLEKPFNPILGETYQGFISGCPVYAEQVSHHPPVSAFQMKGRGYDIDGHLEATASMSANSVTGKNVGYMRAIYHNTGAKQLFIQCPGALSGTAFGTRIFNLSGRGWCIDVENLLIADITYNPSKGFMGRKDLTPDSFAGAVYKVKPQAIGRYRKEGYAKYTGLDFNKEVEDKLYEFSGVWNEYLEVNGQRVFSIHDMYPYKMVNHPNPLPSDANYRLDILYWKLQDFDNSQRNKEKLEVIQRGDRKFREKYHGKKH